jgi:hypothetical protein
MLEGLLPLRFLSMCGSAARHRKNQDRHNSPEFHGLSYCEFFDIPAKNLAPLPVPFGSDLPGEFE